MSGPPMREQDLERFVRDLAGVLGWLRYHTWLSRRSPAGFPDEVLVKGTRLVFAELKGAKGRLSPAQVVWLNALALAGAEVYVWRPVHLDAIAALLGATHPGRELAVQAGAWELT